MRGNEILALRRRGFPHDLHHPGLDHDEIHALVPGPEQLRARLGDPGLAVSPQALQLGDRQQRESLVLAYGCHGRS